MKDHPFLVLLRSLDPIARTGRVTKILPTFVEADGPSVARGSLCEIECLDANGRVRAPIVAEVASVDRDTIRMVPLETDASIVSGARVTARNATVAPVGDACLGRAVDALGRPIDDHGPIRSDARAAIAGEVTAPLSRTSSASVLETGVRAIDGLLTLGQGQRIGLFAASGVGKTTLVNQLANQVQADRCVICLVGERGREVEALWSRELDSGARRRTTLVAATSDETAAMRVRAATYSLALAEHWRAQGHNVLLLLDSVTRLAMAMREIGLAAGEPPTVRAYTPSVFSAIPKLIEQCGALKTGGSITAIMTVLSETDDVDDPISEMMKSLLDGHIILSRSLAEQGHFPAIDVPRSISRLASRLTNDAHGKAAERAVALLSTYEASRTLIETGIYVKGASPEIDRALELRPKLLEFLKQRPSDQTPFNDAREALVRITGKAA